jgi:hypothetical protein
MTPRIAIIGGSTGTLLAAVFQAAARDGLVVEPQEHPPSIKERNLRGPQLNAPPNPWSGERRRAQWKDETQRRGRQR